MRRLPHKYWRVLIGLLLVVYGLSFYYLSSGETHHSNSNETQSIIRSRPRIPSMRLQPQAPVTNITKISTTAYVVHAYLDERDGNMDYPCVRILLISRKQPKARCRFAGDRIVQASIYEMAENHNMPLGVYYANCKIPDGTKEDTEIEIAAGGDFVGIEIGYRIQDEKRPMKYEIEYGVCVPALFGDKYSGKHLVEFMELSLLLGIQHVTIYADIAKLQNDISHVFNFYAQQGLVTVIDFPIGPLESSIWYHGQLVAISDCLIRSVGVIKYLAFHDLDEYIIPLHEETALEVLRQRFTEKVGSYRIPTQYMGGISDNIPPITLRAQLKGELNTRFTKCVIRPEMVFEQGIHHTSRVIQDDYTMPNGKGNDLQVYHYKKANSNEKSEIVLEKYGSELTANFKSVVELLKL